MSPTARAIEAVRQDERERIVSDLHRLVGICGHCRKKKCADRENHSTLPEMLPVGAVLIAVLNKVAKAEGRDARSALATEPCEGCKSGDKPKDGYHEIGDWTFKCAHDGIEVRSEE